MYHKGIIVKISMKKVIVPIAQECVVKAKETWPYISADNIHKLVYFEIFRNTLLLKCEVSLHFSTSNVINQIIFLKFKFGISGDFKAALFCQASILALTSL